MSRGREPWVWTPERVEWLRSEAPEWTAAPLAKRFERRFLVRVSAQAIYAACSRFGIEIGREATREPGRGGGRPRSYGARDAAWFVAAARGRTRGELAEAFAARYGGRPDVGRLKDFAARRGLSLRALCDPAPNRGAFGARRRPEAPVGAERVLSARMRGARLQREIVEVKTAPGGAGWRRKAVVEWERAHGRPVPAGEAVLQLDGDPANCAPSNLELVDRGTLALLNKRDEFARAPVEMRRALVQAARLEVAAKRRAEGLAA